jgi:hypothetical protein
MGSQQTEKNDCTGKNLVFFPTMRILTSKHVDFSQQKWGLNQQHGNSTNNNEDLANKNGELNINHSFFSLMKVGEAGRNLKQFQHGT